MSITPVDLLRAGGWLLGGMGILVLSLFAACWKLTRSDVVNLFRAELAGFKETLATCVTTEKLESSVNRIHERIDSVSKDVSRVEREASAELQESLLRIENKLDQKEEKDSRARHDIRDQVHALSLKIERALKFQNGDG
ncbi:MAG: hypothetical protein ACRD3E_16900 [Terriglobales bacterium]